MNILMSVDNPYGQKLEQLLENIVQDLDAKIVSMSEKEQTEIVIYVKRKNAEIKWLLIEARAKQLQLLARIEREYGPIKGSANPRF